MSPLVLVGITFVGCMFLFAVGVAAWTAFRIISKAGEDLRHLSASMGVTGTALANFGDMLMEFDANLAKLRDATLAKVEGLRNDTCTELVKLRDDTVRTLENKQVIDGLKAFPQLVFIGVKLEIEIVKLCKVLESVSSALIVKPPQDNTATESELFRYDEERAAANEAAAKGIPEDLPASAVPAGTSAQV